MSGAPRCGPECGNKVHYTSKGARRVLKEHLRALCPKCMSGCYTWGKYRCEYSEKERWHLGHDRKESEGGWRPKRKRTRGVTQRIG